MRAKRLFRIKDYPTALAAVEEAHLYARLFSYPHRHRNSGPLLWVKHDKDLNAYYIEPNQLYMPKNPAWKDLVKYESVESER